MSVSQPKQIVSLAPFVTEILAHLGLSQNVQTLRDLLEDQPPASDASRGEHWFTMAVNRVLDLKPDLVFTYSLSQQTLGKKLKEKGLTVVHLDPYLLREVEDGFTQIGKAAGALDASRKMSRDFIEGLEKLSEKIPGGAYRPKLYVEEWNKPQQVPGRWWPDLMTQAGAHYFPILPREINRQAKIEEIIRFDPDVILFSVYGVGLDFNPDEALKRIGWEKIMAVRKRKVYSLDARQLNWPGPRLLEGAQAVQSALGESYWGWPLVDATKVRRVTN
ncbi:MAG TPA: ABC transporter substrate-binding protein [bacterium]|nr:ABC transporter substrate-binding protein [bacterium]